MKNQGNRLAVFPEWVISAFNKKQKINIGLLEMDMELHLNKSLKLDSMQLFFIFMAIVICMVTGTLIGCFFLGEMKSTTGFLPVVLTTLFLISVIFSTVSFRVYKACKRAYESYVISYRLFQEPFKELRSNWDKVAELVINPQLPPGSDREITLADFEARRRAYVRLNLESRKAISSKSINIDRAADLILLLSDFVQNDRRLNRLSDFLLWLGVEHVRIGALFQSVESELSNARVSRDSDSSSGGSIVFNGEYSDCH